MRTFSAFGGSAYGGSCHRQTRYGGKIMIAGLLLLAAVLPAAVNAADRTWVCPSTTTGNWFVATNWSSAQAPTNIGDSAIITNGYVLLTNSTAVLASFSISNATLIFSNWNTALNATTVTVQNAGTLTLPPAFTTNQMSNNIYVACSNFALNTGGTIFADARGFASSNGPGAGASSPRGGGGGYGGKGGNSSGAGGGGAGGSPYGSTNAPLDPGSGGGQGQSGAGGHGGGAVRIEAAGGVTINGSVTANGGDGGSSYGGGGSGGAIYMTCASFGGSTSGILQANGGSGYPSAQGGGGGGRIAVTYQSLSGTPGVRFSARRGLVSWKNVDANAPVDCPAPQMGTLCFTNSALLDSVLAAWGGTGSGLNGYFVFQSTNVWVPTNLLVLSNSTLGVPEGYSWQITNDLTVTATGGVVVAAHATLVCGGNLLLTNGASLIVYGGETNATYTNYGTLVGVTNMLTVASNCWIYPFSHSTNGGSVLFRIGSLVISGGTNGGINADGRGYAGANGRGAGASSPRGGGGGYGGKGGNSSGTGGGGAGGNPYGSTNAPLDPGSGGGQGQPGAGGHGGGAVRIEAAGGVTINGSVTANGGDGGISYGGGGSGGAIYLTCASFGGSTSGILQANGGSGYPSEQGGGGGGRIAVWVDVPPNIRNRYINSSGADGRAVARSTDWPQFAGTISVAPGAGYYNYPPDTRGAYPGTCFFFRYVKGAMLGVGQGN